MELQNGDIGHALLSVNEVQLGTWKYNWEFDVKIFDDFNQVLQFLHDVQGSETSSDTLPKDLECKINAVKIGWSVKKKNFDVDVQIQNSDFRCMILLECADVRQESGDFDRRTKTSDFEAWIYLPGLPEELTEFHVLDNA